MHLSKLLIIYICRGNENENNSKIFYFVDNKGSSTFNVDLFVTTPSMALIEYTSPIHQPANSNINKIVLIS